MKAASYTLGASVSYPDGLPIYFLTGEKYIYQTLFCIRSLARVTDSRFRFIVVDDGSITDKLRKRIQRQLPHAELVTQAMIENNLRFSLPKNLYPNIHHKRAVYPHIKKLTDIHTLMISDWKLVLDSDMLFFKYPEKMIAWLNKPEKNLHLRDCQESYGYSQNLMNKLCGNKIPYQVNVGVVGLNSSAINWPAIEQWITELERLEGASYYLEQAITAMIVSGDECVVLDAEDHIVNPNHQIIKERSGVLHHYVDLSKSGYFRQAWKTV